MTEMGHIAYQSIRLANHTLAGKDLETREGRHTVTSVLPSSDESIVGFT